MNKRILNALHLFVLAAIFFVLGGAHADGQIMAISVPKLALGKGERIIGFEVHVHSGRIALLPNIPIGWNISVDNDPSWETVVSGTIEVGGAAADTDFLQDFMVIEKEPHAPPEIEFNLSGEIVVTSDFKNERKIKLAMKDFGIKGAGRSSATGNP